MEPNAQRLFASASYKKVPGTLSLEDGILRWKPSLDSSSIPGFSVQDTHLKGLKVSKPGAAQVALRLEAAEGYSINGEPIAMINFNAEQDIACANREKFKDRLAAAIAKARAEQEQQAAVDAEHAGKRKALEQGTRAGGPKVPDMSAVKLRGQVLRANPGLLALHKDVVGTDLISDADFWEHPARKALLRAEYASMEQRQGRRGQLADPKPSQTDKGEMKINITPQLIRDLFEQYPVLTRAYDENVPSKLDEGTFWARYFQSRLYHRLRTSLRSAASEQALRDDDIFDKYLEAEDDELAPRTEVNPHDALLNLAATQEDHVDTGNMQDWTMRAGFDRRMLPLVRRFNKHAESVLTSSLGTLDASASARSKRKTGGVGEEYKRGDSGRYYEEIVMDDLQHHAKRVEKRLEIHDQRAYFDAHTGNAARPMVAAVDMDAYMSQLSSNLRGWKLDVQHFVPHGKGMRHALDAMLDNMRQQDSTEHENIMSDLPSDVHKQVISCQAATIEFLQQFWQAISPSAAKNTQQNRGVHLDIPQRIEKAKRMLVVLAKTDERIGRIAATADAALPGTGGEIVHEAA
ncbi:Tfb1p [Malassezia vespertilionis]|uniref:Tfb1p n=1 Tax=Malassezia vespertilionis TaxID=2020962 RepID=A0A2N1JFF5_9BASI|nr:Tfb1p [Malassezia vespertilionis]